VDDDGDGQIDCADVNCAFNAECLGGDGDADVDADVDSDLDSNLPGPDGDSSVDGQVLPSPVRRCDGNSDCLPVLDLGSCCGRPREVDGDMVACQSAANRNFTFSDPCLVGWTVGASLPAIPGECTAPADCQPNECPACRPVRRALCQNGSCVLQEIQGCLNDSECDEGQHCADSDNDGIKECLAGAHSCPISGSAECLAQFPQCNFCQCIDTDGDGLRDCDCKFVGDAGMLPCPAP
jgi:hypothetical protein